MSRLSSVVDKPFTKTLTWRNEKFDKKLKKVTQEKGFYYYEKGDGDEKGTNILVEAPFTFLWLLSTTSFTGFNEAESQSIYSNEVLSERDLKEFLPRDKDEAVDEYTKRMRNAMVLKAKMGKETIAEGFYKDIKDNVVAKGGKYCQPVYGLLVNADGSTEIVRILMSGSSLQTWIPFNNATKLRTMGVQFKGAVVEQSKGSNEYESPVYEYVPVSKALLKSADEAANTVVDYFKFLIGSKEVKEELAEVESPTEEGDLPWN